MTSYRYEVIPRYEVTVPRYDFIPVRTKSYRYYETAPKFCCRNNYLKITDDNNVQVGQYCGDLAGIDVFVYGAFAVITFNSEFRIYSEKKRLRVFQILFTNVKMPGKCK